MAPESRMFQGDLFFHVSVYATRANRHNWGDTQYAEGLLQAIRALPGCGGDLLFRDEVPDLVPGRDVVLRIIGPHPEAPLPGVPNLLWMISPPNIMPTATLARYQSVFVASQLFASYLHKTGIPARYMPQATAIGHFHPDRRRPGAPEIPVAFVGAYAPRADRRLVLYAVKAGHDVRIWGPGGQGVVPDRCLQGARLTYDELAETYATARVVLNSHMPQMAERGFMSNRSYDALASGARVISDHIPGFSAPDLPELTCVKTAADLLAQLDAALARPVADLAARRALHDRTAQGFGFDSRARAFVDCARQHLAAGQVAAAPRDRSLAKALAKADAPLRLSDPAQSAPTQQAGLLAAAEEILHLARAYPPAQPPQPPQPAARQGVIHPLMSDLREMQALICGPATPEAGLRVDALATKALRVVEVLHETAPGLALGVSPREVDSVLARLIRDQPLWGNSPDSYHRDTNKRHLALRPRRNPAVLSSPVGVFLHLFYDDLAEAFAARLALIDAPMAVYVSTDTEAKAAAIARHLPQAEIRLLPNRGRDIWAKLYGFGDVYDRHEVIRASAWQEIPPFRPAG